MIKPQDREPKAGTMPGWAQNVDNAGRRMWRRHRNTNADRQGEYIGAIICNAILLYFINQIPNWNIPFITNDFGIILWVINLSLLAQIVGNGLMLLYKATWWRSAILMLVNAIGVWATYVFYVIFPVDLSVITGDWANNLLKICLIVGMVFGVLAIVFHFIRFIFSLTFEIVD